MHNFTLAHLNYTSTTINFFDSSIYKYIISCSLSFPSQTLVFPSTISLMLNLMLIL